MKKSAKLSLAIALMMGVTAGSQIAGMNTASAEISDNFKLEVNGVISNVMDKDNAGGYTAQDNYKIDPATEKRNIRKAIGITIRV